MDETLPPPDDVIEIPIENGVTKVVPQPKEL